MLNKRSGSVPTHNFYDFGSIVLKASQRKGPGKPGEIRFWESEKSPSNPRGAVVRLPNPPKVEGLPAPTEADLWSPVAAGDPSGKSSKKEDRQGISKISDDLDKVISGKIDTGNLGVTLKTIADRLKEMKPHGDYSTFDEYFTEALEEEEASDGDPESVFDLIYMDAADALKKTLGDVKDSEESDESSSNEDDSEDRSGRVVEAISPREKRAEALRKISSDIIRVVSDLSAGKISEEDAIDKFHNASGDLVRSTPKTSLGAATRADASMRITARYLTGVDAQLSLAKKHLEHDSMRKILSQQLITTLSHSLEVGVRMTEEANKFFDSDTEKLKKLEEEGPTHKRVLAAFEKIKSGKGENSSMFEEHSKRLLGEMSKALAEYTSATPGTPERAELFIKLKRVNEQHLLAQQQAGLAKSSEVSDKLKLLEVPDPINISYDIKKGLGKPRRSLAKRGMERVSKFISSKVMESSIHDWWGSADRKLYFDTPKVEHKSHGRSYALGAGIHIATNNRDVTTIAHEFGHHIEYMSPVTRERFRAFREERTRGEEAVRLKDLTGDNSYADTEMTKPDKFPHAYCGKEYPGDATEMLSMGIEMMTTDPEEFAKQDGEYFDLVYDVFRGE